MIYGLWDNCAELVDSVTDISYEAEIDGAISVGLGFEAVEVDFQ